MHNLSISDYAKFQKEVEALPASDLFDAKGRVLEDRPKVFNHLKEIIKHLDEAIFEVRNYVERLDVVLSIKHQVLGFPYLYYPTQ